MGQEFWDWTWDDLVTHELSAIIDFVFKNTGRKIHYVGHSLVRLLLTVATDLLIDCRAPHLC